MDAREQERSRGLDHALPGDTKKDRRVEINIGWPCTNACVFCTERGKIREARKRGVPIIQPLEKVVELLKKYRERDGANHFTVLGGEPTIQPHFFDVVRAARELGYETIFVTTNARKCADYEFAKKFLASGVNHVCVSIHGVGQVHDALTRREGSFNETFQGLKNILRARQELGLRVPVMTNTVINKKNYEQLPLLSSLLAPLPLEQSLYYFVIIEGFDKQKILSIVPRMSEVYPFLERSARIFESHNALLRIANMPFCVLPGLWDKVDEIDWAPRVIYEDLHKETLQAVMVGKKKTKLASCSLCMFQYYCDGISTEYLEEFGSDEFHPVKGEKIRTREQLLRIIGDPLWHREVEG